MLKALDFLFDIKGVPKKRGRKSIEYYNQYFQVWTKIIETSDNGYEVLHLYGYMKAA